MSKAIHTPALPPKAGYVEVEVNGERQYKKVPPSAEEQAIQEVTAVLAALLEGEETE